MSKRFTAPALRSQKEAAKQFLAEQSGIKSDDASTVFAVGSDIPTQRICLHFPQTHLRLWMDVEQTRQLIGFLSDHIRCVEGGKKL